MNNLAPSSAPISEQEKLDWLRLTRTENVGPITFYKLIDMYGTAQNALEQLPELSKKSGRKKPLIPPPPERAEKEYAAIKAMGGDIVCAHEDAYPLALGTLDDAPPVLTYMGHLDMVRSCCLGIVGARNASLNGRKFAYKMAQDLGKSEKIVVSGLARGIDTAAHEGALATGTIAVIAGGLDIVYPRENQKLYDAIKEQGLIIAESPLGMEPIARHFPKRNRIVSGLSEGVIVIEATIRSGSLITARMAGEQGRDVYAVPGYPADPRAAGPNKLIKDGATLIENSKDVLSALNNFTGSFDLQDSHHQSDAPLDFNRKIDQRDLNEIKEVVLQNISQLPVEIDELARTCHVSIPDMQMALLEMELSGMIERLPGNRLARLDG